MAYRVEAVSNVVITMIVMTLRSLNARAANVYGVTYKRTKAAQTMLEFVLPEMMARNVSSVPTIMIVMFRGWVSVLQTGAQPVIRTRMMAVIWRLPSA